MKKHMIWILALVGVLLLGGCGESQSGSSTLLDPKEPITITFWHYYGDYVQAKLTAIVDEFNATVGAKQGVVVVPMAKPSIADLEAELTESAQGVVYADEMPSMFLAYPDKILELQELGVISNLDDYLSQEDKDRIIESFLDTGVIHGEQVMLPVVKSTELIFINETHWNAFAQEAGYTDDDLLTWEGVAAVAEDYYAYTDALTPDTPNDGKAFFGFDSLQNFVVVSSKQLGVDIFDDQTDTGILDMDIMAKIYHYYTENYALGYFDSVGKFRTDDMRSGDILAFVGSSASFAYIPEWIEVDGAKEDITWKSLPYPTFEGGTSGVVSQGAGIAVSKVSEQQQEASALFLNFFLEYNIDFALDTAYVPVIEEFMEGSSDIEEMLATYDLEQNEIGTYVFVMEQIESDALYQAAAFDGSYAIRTELATTIEQAGLNARKMVEEAYANGTTAEELDLDIEALFPKTWSVLIQTLENRGVNLQVVGD